MGRMRPAVLAGILVLVPALAACTAENGPSPSLTSASVPATGGTMPDAPDFMKEMQQSPAPWQFVVFGGAVHCFAEPWSHSPPGCVYDAPVAKRAFALMHAGLAVAFAVKSSTPPPRGVGGAHARGAGSVRRKWLVQPSAYPHACSSPGGREIRFNRCD